MSVTAAQGFRAAGVRAGLKASGKPDLALVVNDGPLDTAAGVFTTNRVVAAPVVWSRRLLAGPEGGQAGHARAVVLNSGSANACTGAQGMHDTEATAVRAAGLLGAEPDQVLVCSTGVIGERIDMPVLLEGVDVAALALADTPQAGTDAATAIMTTDTVSKEVAVRFPLGGKMCKLGGISKGSGMIAPNMATMLCFLTTDAAISSVALKRALTTVTADTFNMLSVDGDTSTNDMVSILANGMAGNAPIEACMGTDYEAFVAALYKVCEKLCAIMAKDGEGATKLLACEVTGAKSTAAAKLVAKAVIKSTLLKAAIFGADANWGRVLCAIGYSGAHVDVHKVDVAFRSTAGTVSVCVDGAGIPFSEEKAKKVLLEQEIEILVDLKSGDEGATAWGCDLTYDYVKINGDYRT